MAPPLVMTRAQGEIDGYLSSINGTAVPGSLFKPVISLDASEVAELFTWILANDIFVVKGGAAGKRKFFHYDDMNGVTSTLVKLPVGPNPPVGKKPLPKVDFDSHVFNGVQFRCVTSWNNRTKTAIVVDQKPTNQDPKMIIFYYKLTNSLKAMFDISEFLHMGMVFGADRTEDAHKQGRACDFAGVRFTKGGEMTVEMHWFGQKVELPQDYKNLKRGTSLKTWPSEIAYTNTNYRLDPANNKYLDQSLSPAWCAYLFYFVYQFAVFELTDAMPAPIGKGPDSVIHPDHRISSPNGHNGREAHHDHIHMNIGTAGDENPAPKKTAVNFRARQNYFRWV